MKHHSDCVSLDLAIKLKEIGFNAPTDRYYKFLTQDGKNGWINETRGLTVKGKDFDKDYNSSKLTKYWHGVICEQYVSAPRYYEVLDWLLDNKIMVSFDDAVEVRIALALERYENRSKKIIQEDESE